MNVYQISKCHCLAHFELHLNFQIGTIHVLDLEYRLVNSHLDHSHLDHSHLDHSHLDLLLHFLLHHHYHDESLLFRLYHHLNQLNEFQFCYCYLMKKEQIFSFLESLPL